MTRDGSMSTRSPNLPRRVARLLDPDEVAGLLAAAASGSTVLVPLDRPPVGRTVVELQAPGLAQPVLVVAEPDGGETAGMYPLRLRPLDEVQQHRLESIDATPAAPGPDPTRLDSLDAPLHDSIELGVHASLDEAFDERPSASVRASSGDPLIGRRVGGGRFAILRPIGAGGIGAVYEAEQLSLKKRVAVKVLHEANERRLELFQREALAASRLAHPNVVQVLDILKDPDGLQIIVMEFVEGQELGHLIRARGHLSLSQISDLGAQICDGLAAAHRHRIVHRDIKPENLLVVERSPDPAIKAPVVKICDFGAARITDAPQTAATRSGILRGTPEFMAPEQVTGELIDARTDLYACGVVLYEMATGRLPFYGDRIVEVLNQHLHQRPRPPSKVEPSVHPKLEAIILKALEKAKERRQQSAEELRDELLDLSFE